MSEANLDMYEGDSQMGDIDMDNLVLRRSEPDDCNQIMNLVEIGKDDIYNRVYNFPEILKLIETAYLSISVLDKEGNILAFAAFEDYPQGMKGTYDDQHFNIWEQWFLEGFEISEFSSLNTLWLTYFITTKQATPEDQKLIFKQIL